MARQSGGILDLFGGLALGLSQSMQANRDAGLKTEYLKAQMDEAKAKGKHYEAQVKADLMKQEMQGNLMKFMQGGMQPGGPQAQGLAPGAPPPMPPQEIPAPQQGAPSAPMAPMSGGGGANIGGINFSGYATDPNWGAGVNSVMSRLPQLGSPDAVEQAIANLAPNSPLAGKGNLIYQLAQQGGYDPRIPLAIAMQESSMGTAGRAVRTQNPMNIGNDDSGRANYMPSIDAGIQAFHDYTLKRTGGGAGGDITQQIAQAQTQQQMQAQQAVGQTLAQVPANKSGGLDIKSMSLQKRTMLDVLFKNAFDLDTNFRKNQMDVREVGGYLYILENNELVKVIPGPGKVELRERVDPATGTTYTYPHHVRPAGQPQEPSYPSKLAETGWTKVPGKSPGEERLQPYNATVPGGPLPGSMGGISGGGQPDIVTSPPGLKDIPDVGRMNSIYQAENALKDLKRIAFDDKGKLRKGVVFSSKIPFGGLGGEGSELYSKLFQAIDAALRIETGAQAPPHEVEQKIKQYGFYPQDSDKTAWGKYNDLSKYINGVIELRDPEGKIRGMRNKGKLNLQPGQKMKTDPLGLR